MRIILIGGGEVGYAVARRLAARHATTIIDHDLSVGDRFSALDVDFIHGSGTSEPVLRRAQIKDADLLVAATGSDEVNIIACAVANNLGSPDTICLVSTEDLLRPGLEADRLRKHFGINRVIWPEAQLAADIERIVAAPGTLDAEVFAGGDIHLVEYRLDADSPLAAQRIAQLHLPHGTLIVGIKQGDTFVIPRGETRLEPGNKIVVMGKPEPLHDVQRRLHLLPPAGGRQRVTIVGGGDVGLRLAQRLDVQSAIDLVIIERDAGRGAMLAGALTNALVLNGDGTDLELLESERIGSSDVMVSVIDNDERNLLASLIGRQLGVKRIVSRVSRMANLRLFERVGIDVALSARGAAVSSIVHHVEGGTANLLAVLEEGEAQILELIVPTAFPPTVLRDLAAPPGSIVGAIVRGDQAIVPRGGDQIVPGDHLLVFTTNASADAIRHYFESGVR